MTFDQSMDMSCNDLWDEQGGPDELTQAPSCLRLPHVLEHVLQMQNAKDVVQGPFIHWQARMNVCAARSSTCPQGA